MLAEQGIIKKKEATVLVRGLNSVRKEIESGVFVFDERLEDIHMHIESRLTEIVGSVARKLHTARSRNDQVALDTRMYLKAEVIALIGELAHLRKTIVALAGKHIRTVLPGYTHLQRAQPVLLAHHLMAYYEMFTRDGDRLRDCLSRIDVMPLGSAALAGTPHPIDRDNTARRLGFFPGLRQQYRRRIGPRFHYRVSGGGQSGHDPFQSAFRGVGDVVFKRIRFYRSSGRICHREQHHAAKEKPRHPRAGSGKKPGGCSVRWSAC